MSLFADTCDASGHILITTNSEQEPSILREEVQAAIKYLKQDKAANEVPIEAIKDIGKIGVDILHIICSQMWDTSEWPKNWSHSLFVPLHKKGSTRRNVTTTN